MDYVFTWFVQFIYPYLLLSVFHEYILCSPTTLFKKDPPSIYMVAELLYQLIIESLQLTAYPYYS